MGEQYDEEGMRRVAWAHRKERMRKQKRKQMLFRRLAKVAGAVAAVLVLALVVKGMMHGEKPVEDKHGTGSAGTSSTSPLATLENLYGEMEQTQKAQEGNGADVQGQDGEIPEDGNPAGTAGVSGRYETSGNTAAPPDGVISAYVIFVDIDGGEILVRREEKTRMNPASMTKILTLLVAAEHIDNLDDTYTITSDIMDYCLLNDCSTAGFERGDTVTIRDLLYGTILPSGAEAALGLANYVSGSQEDFVKLMNERLEEMGLSETTHFTNCVGVYDANHYSTAYDMAVIMEHVLANELCREVMSARTYTTGSTARHPEGIELSNWFIRRIEDKDVGNGKVTCAKTGYVVQAKQCAVSYGEGGSGKRYICVTAGAEGGRFTSVGEHAKIYVKFMK